MLAGYTSCKAYINNNYIGDDILFSFLYNSDDLLQPSNNTKSESEIIDDSSLVDPRPLYFPDKQLDVPNKLSVRELKVALENEEEKHNFCLDESQREAVYKALSHPLTVIQVWYKLSL